MDGTKSLSSQGAGWTLRMEPHPDGVIREGILAPLVAHNDGAAGPGDWGLLAITVRNCRDEIVGGLWGRTGYGFLFVELLALGSARGNGLGRQVMAMAEAEAGKRGLSGIWLDTWTFQAPEFYRGLGFEECGRIRDYPPGHDRIFFVKRLTPP